MTVQISQVEVPENEVETSPASIFVTTRPYVAVPTNDVRMFVSNQTMTFGLGFVFGVGVGALFGNIISDLRRKIPKR